MLLRFKFFLNCKRLPKGKAASNLRRNFSSHVTEFGFRIEIFARGIRNHGIFCLWNQESCTLEPGIAQENQNPTNVWLPLTKTGIRNRESGIHSVESRIQVYLDCLEFPFMG